MIRPVSENKNNSWIKGLAVAGGAGAALYGGLNYAGQKHIIKHADDYIPAFRKGIESLGKTTENNIVQKKVWLDFIQNIKTGKITKGFVAASALTGAVTIGALYLAGKAISHAYNSERGSLENNTLKVGITGGIIAGLLNYAVQKLRINELKSLKETTGTLAQHSMNALGLTSNFNIKNLKQHCAMTAGTLSLFSKIAHLADNARISKSMIAGSFLRGGIIMGTAYAAARGVTSLLFKQKQPQIAFIKIPDEVLEPEIVE